MRFPNVLIIGAMKSGTTSLYRALAEHPECFLAEDKEPHALCSDRVLTEEGMKEYSAIYSKAGSDRICIDASTGYSKRPDYEGAASRALKLLPNDFKVIYLIRHPVERIISQHHHEYSRGEVGEDVNKVVRSENRFINYSRYSYQLQPWIDAVGWSRIKVVQFERFIDSSAGIIKDLHCFLGLSDILAAPTSPKAYNKSQGKPVLNDFWRVVKESGIYRQRIRPLLPMGLRWVLFKTVLPKAPNQLCPPTPETVDWLRNQLAPDVQELYLALGSSTALWDDFPFNPSDAVRGTPSIT